MIFEIRGRKLEFDLHFEAKNTYRKRMKNLSITLIDRYFEEIYEAPSVIETIQIVRDKYKEGCLEVYEKVVEILVSFDIYTETVQTLYEKYGLGDLMDETLAEIEGKVDALNQKDQMKYYEREERKKNRSHWEGGGFGVDGAIKGALTAGALNMGTGLLRSIADFMVEGYDTVNYYKEQKRILEDDAVYISLMEDMRLTFFNTGIKVVIRELVRYNVLGDTFFDVKGARAVFQNVKSYVHDREKAIDMVIDCIIQAPYEAEFYQYLVDVCCDREGEIENMAEELGISEVRAYKQSLIKVLERMPQDTLENVQLKIRSIEIRCKEMGYTLDEKSIKDLRSREKELNVKSRTVEGIVYGTREDARNARDKLRTIEKIIKGTELTDKASITQAIAKIEGIKARALGEKYIKELNEKWVEVDEKERTYKGHVYDSKELMALAERETEEIIVLLESMDHTLEKYQEVYERINQGFHTTHIKPVVLTNLSKKIEELKIQQELESRIVAGICMDTYEEAEKERRAYRNIQEKIKNLDLDEQTNIHTARKIIEDCRASRMKEEFEAHLNMCMAFVDIHKRICTALVPSQLRTIKIEVGRTYNSLKFTPSISAKEEMMHKVESKIEETSSDTYKDRYEKALEYQEAKLMRSPVFVLVLLVMECGVCWGMRWVVNRFISGLIVDVVLGIVSVMMIKMMWGIMRDESKEGLKYKDLCQELLKKGEVKELDRYS